MLTVHQEQEYSTNPVYGMYNGYTLSRRSFEEGSSMQLLFVIQKYFVGGCLSTKNVVWTEEHPAMHA